MKSFFTSTVQLTTLAFSALLYISCIDKSSEIKRNSSGNQQEESFKEYWYSGTAELSSYKLEQSRYGELHSGEAVLIFVTEDFHKKKQVKADRNQAGNIPVLKLNSTKKFLTGLYPYSIMSSTFYPVSNDRHALKTSLSAQEWCGHVYMQLNNRKNFEITTHSYFEEAADQQEELSKGILENEIWTQLRIDPESLPMGKTEMIPSLEYLRMNHKEVKAYPVEIDKRQEDGLMVYEINYPGLERRLSIYYTADFPYLIDKWEERASSQFVRPGIELITKAERIKTIQTDYWNKNKRTDLPMRKDLGL